MIINIHEELARLPAQIFQSVRQDSPSVSNTLQILSKQGRLIAKLNASMDSLEQSYAGLSVQLHDRGVQIEGLESQVQAAYDQIRKTSLVAIQLLDALDWVHQSLLEMDQASFARDVSSAQLDCVRRLASVGISEIPATGPIDGHLHEALDAVVSPSIPKYHIVKVIRRGFQSGANILRRAGVVTSAA